MTNVKNVLALHISKRIITNHKSFKRYN